MAYRRGLVLRGFFFCLLFGSAVLGLYLYLAVYKGAEHNSESYVSMPWNRENSHSSNRINYVMSNVPRSLSPAKRRLNDPRKQLVNKIVHLDLKGMPYRVEAYKTLFPFLKQIGVTGILMEYEDMFPYHGRLQAIANKQAYTKSDIKHILEYAKSSQLMVIPLVQTFGHLEFVLKLEPFASIREVPRYPQVVCPTNNRSGELIREMINQIMEMHPGIQYLHIGSDEVYHIGMCPLCIDRMSRHNLDVSHLFLQHVASVARYVTDTFHVRPIMWDDEFRKLDHRTIRNSGIADLVDLVVWNYHIDVENRLDPGMWKKYSSLFKNFWVGSAFKGANKPNSMIVNETLYLLNHFSWVETMASVDKLVSFKGVFLTGWQRYDHFSVLCELLPSAIPSLTACMSFLASSSYPPVSAVLANTSVYLDCQTPFRYCYFPGSKIHHSINQLQLSQESFSKLQEKNVVLGWAQEVNFRMQFSNPSHVETISQDVQYLSMEFDKLRQDLIKNLGELYPSWSVEEWIATNVDPYVEKLTSLKTNLAKILDNTVFPVRPLKLQAHNTVEDGNVP